jgi:hypothetical protein
LFNCTIFDVRCSAVCSCFRGFGGRDCSLTSAELAELDASRGQLCLSLLNTLTVSDPSAELLDSVVNSLQQSFDPIQVGGVFHCKYAYLTFFLFVAQFC